MLRLALVVACLTLTLATAGCGGGGSPGVDAAKQVVSIGVLNDESGPVSAIGRPWGAGLRVLAREVNEGNSGFLPPGWKIQLVERDHGYDAQRALAQFNEIEKRVLYIGTSLGTPNTLALQPQLSKRQMVAFPASLSSALHNSQYTPPIGPSYRVEVARALDWMAQQAAQAKAPEARAVKLALLYQRDDYGMDALAAVDAAAPELGISVVARQPYAAGQSDFAFEVGALKASGATHVMLATMPSATAPILAAAAAQAYRPTWVGNSPAWLDRYYDTRVVPSALFENFYWANSFAYWGENVPMMKGFLAAYEKYGREMAPPDSYILAGYAAGLLQMEILSRFIRSGDLTREGFLRALRATRDYDTYGVVAEPIDFTRFPYVTGTRSRILKPDFARQTWTVVGGYAEPGVPLR